MVLRSSASLVYRHNEEVERRELSAFPWSSSFPLCSHYPLPAAWPNRLKQSRRTGATLWPFCSLKQRHPCMGTHAMAMGSLGCCSLFKMNQAIHTSADRELL